MGHWNGTMSTMSGESQQTIPFYGVNIIKMNSMTKSLVLLSRHLGHNNSLPLILLEKIFDMNNFPSNVRNNITSYTGQIDFLVGQV